MKKQLLAILLLSFSTTVFCQQINIIPKPNNTKITAGHFVVNAATVIICGDGGEKNTANFLNSYLKKFYGFQLKISKQATGNYIQLFTKKFITAPDNSAAYSLTVTPKNIVISGDGYEGTFYGMQSLIGLLPIRKSTVKTQKLSVQCLVINDAPHFAYRGMHLDVSRHFFGVDYVKKYIDFIALHKMNYFHWHLTDDQGWRIEIKKYPKLTSVGGYRNGTIIGRYPGTGNDSLKYGGFYTQEQIKDVVKYAAERFITIVPEIDVPGHSLAAIVAYPELSTTPNVPKQVGQTWGLTDIDNVLNPSDSTFAFLDNVLSEVVELFPGKYIHIGGDECNKRWWRESVFCQDLMKKEGLKNTDALQSYFIHRIEKMVNAKGRLMMGWDEILEGGLAPNALVMSWQGEKGGIEAAKQKHNVVMTPGTYCYFDHSQTKNEDSITIGSYLPVEKVYNYNPVPAKFSAEDAKYILGAQGNVWTEYIGSESKLEYMIFPRISALSEAVWTEQKNKNLPDFEQRLQQQFERYDLWKVNSSKAFYDIKDSIYAAKDKKGLIWELKTKLKGGEIWVNQNYNDYDETIGMKKDSIAIVVTKTNKYTVELYEYFKHNDQKVKSRQISTTTQTFSFNLATGKKITLINPPAAQYPGNGGAFGLVNGITSTKGINSAEWLGWNGKDIEAIIDFGKTETFTTVALDVLQQEGSWIYLPQSISVFTSANGKDFTEINAIKLTDVADKTQHKIKLVLASQTAQYLKIIAHNTNKINEGKPGAGKPAWLFVDEIVVE